MIPHVEDDSLLCTPMPYGFLFQEINKKLIDSTVNITEVSDTEINKIKFNAIKSAVIKRLKGIIGLIESDKYDEIKKYTAWSPAGDDMGLDNNFIDFGFVVNESSSMDIIEITNMLKEYGNKN